jgi:hypothetical protein
MAPTVSSSVTIPKSDYYPNEHVIAAVISASKSITGSICAADADMATDGADSTAFPRSELDSHANMIIIIRNYRLGLHSRTSACTRKRPQLGLKPPHYLPPPLH